MSVDRRDNGSHLHLLVQIASIFGFLNIIARPAGNDLPSTLLLFDGNCLHGQADTSVTWCIGDGECLARSTS